MLDQRGHAPAGPARRPLCLSSRRPTRGSPRPASPGYLNWGMTLSVRSRRVFITTSRGTEAVQLTSNMISSALKVSRRK